MFVTLQWSLRQESAHTWVMTVLESVWKNARMMETAMEYRSAAVMAVEPFVSIQMVRSAQSWCV